MSENSVPISIAVRFAWNTAGESAKKTGRQIEIAHLLFGIFGLDKVPERAIPADRRPEFQSDLEELKTRFGGYLIDQDEAKQVLVQTQSFVPLPEAQRSQSDKASVPTRSNLVRQAFLHASQHSATQSGRIGVSALLLELLILDKRLAFLMGFDDVALSVLAARLSLPRSTATVAHKSREPLSILESINASESVSLTSGSVSVGAAIARICELTWASGISNRLDPFFEQAVQLLIEVIPRGQQAAILLGGPTGELLLKAHYPKGVLPVSSSCAKRTLGERRSFIWQRGEDLSASQAASNLRAGIYAPIIVGNEVFGVLCLDTTAPAADFSADDLFLTTFLGHQIGVTYANKKLEERLLQKHRVLERLLTNFSPKVRNKLLQKAEAGRLTLGGEKSLISILCSDIRGFTVLTEVMEADEIMDLLNSYFTPLVAVIFKYGGSIDKFMGDAIMAVFGSPESDPDHTEHSLHAAMEMQAEVARITQNRRQMGLPYCGMGIGVHQGEVIHGFVGSQDRMEFTVIGAPVNMASRYCAAAQSGEVIVSQQVVEKVWQRVTVEARSVETKHEGNTVAFVLKSIL